MKRSCVWIGIFAALAVVGWSAESPDVRTLSDTVARLEWKRDANGWRLTQVAVQTPRGELAMGAPTGEYTLLFSAQAPDTTPIPSSLPGQTEPFPERAYIYNIGKWNEAMSPVSLNRAGEERRFTPTTVERSDEVSLRFGYETDMARVDAEWMLDPSFPGDVRVALFLTAKRDGYFSLATPTLTTIPVEDLAWAVVPGYFQGNTLNPNLPLALAYGHGLPDKPVISRERGTSTLASIATHRSGATLAVIAEPGMGADPWPSDAPLRNTWRLGVSHMNRRGELAPTLYHPVLGQSGSKLASGEKRTFLFRYSLRAGDWFGALKHAANDVYRLPDSLVLKQPQRSLSERLLSLHGYVTDDKTSLWRLEDFGGLKIGAQAYLGGIVSSDKDGMKNSDYGAMWMLAKLTGDPKLTQERLPYARNFKLMQQQREPGFFQGAAVGQYYLSKSRRFTEEWGNYVEPVALTYYTLLDLGNILLFAPGDTELRERLRLGADRLLAWQQPEGNWDVAYDHVTHERRFTELPDLRPTFYGLLVAYRVLGDAKYLDAARRGADWIVSRAVEKGQFLGVCGDCRFAPDFATAQIAQALLDMAETTGESRYREAAIATARFYVTSIFTHPLVTTQKKQAGGAERAEWEISQQGLSFEHGGSIGSATAGGPILLASHAGLFVRIHQLTGETLFRDLARAGALARDAFVHAETSVASYYWNAMNRGAGPYPHHAWWQIGWITDYLIAEAETRSGGQVTFPAGFFTPKVGPHRSYGFAPGKVLGDEAALGWGRVVLNHPAVDYLVVNATKRNRVYVVLLNQRAELTPVVARPDATELTRGKAKTWKSARVVAGAEAGRELPGTALQLPAYGWSIVALDY